MWPRRDVYAHGLLKFTTMTCWRPTWPRRDVYTNCWSPRQWCADAAKKTWYLYMEPLFLAWQLTLSCGYNRGITQWYPNCSGVGVPDHWHWAALQQAWYHHPSWSCSGSSCQGIEECALILMKGDCGRMVKGGGLDWRPAPPQRSYLFMCN